MRTDPRWPRAALVPLCAFLLLLSDPALAGGASKARTAGTAEDAAQLERAKQPNAALESRYVAAIQSRILDNWVRPDGIAVELRCSVRVAQIPGGYIVSATATAPCGLDEAGMRSLEEAVLRAQPLPYRGFEAVFNRSLTLEFSAE